MTIIKKNREIFPCEERFIPSGFDINNIILFKYFINVLLVEKKKFYSTKYLFKILDKRTSRFRP